LVILLRLADGDGTELCNVNSAVGFYTAPCHNKRKRICFYWLVLKYYFYKEMKILHLAGVRLFLHTQ